MPDTQSLVEPSGAPQGMGAQRRRVRSTTTPDYKYTHRARWARFLSSQVAKWGGRGVGGAVRGGVVARRVRALCLWVGVAVKPCAARCQTMISDNSASARRPSSRL